MGSRSLECASLNGSAPGADRPHRPYAHRGDQSARGLQLSHRAARQAAAPVTLGGEIRACGSLIGVTNAPRNTPSATNRTPNPINFLQMIIAKFPRKTASSYRHFWHQNQGDPSIGPPTGSRSARLSATGAARAAIAPRATRPRPSCCARFARRPAPYCPQPICRPRSLEECRS